MAGLVDGQSEKCTKVHKMKCVKSEMALLANEYVFMECNEPTSEVPWAIPSFPSHVQIVCRATL